MRPKNLELEGFFPIFEKYKNEIFDSNFEVRLPSDPVWGTIAKESGSSYTRKYLYTLVKLNRYNFLHRLRSSLPIPECHGSCSSSSDHESEKLYSSDSSITSSERLDFDITLSSQEWQYIHPECKKYHDGKTYSVLPAGKWTNLIAAHFWDLTKLSCTLVFKRAKVYETGHYLKFVASCKNCHSILTGGIPSKPHVQCRAVLKCQYIGSFGDCKSKFKRQLRGDQRIQVGNLLLEHGIVASSYRKEKANKLMVIGDVEPSILPTSHTIRNAKYEINKNNRLHDNEILSLQILKYKYPYNNYIKDIGIDRFFIHYWSTPQIHVYNNYIKLSPYSKIAIDATGKVVRPLTRPDGSKSRAILLYDVTVRDTSTKMQYSVASMNLLSERHDSDSIMHWLCFWKRSGAMTPNEIVCDMSLALVSGIIRSFIDYSSLQLYLEDCFNFLILGQPLKFNINCFVRFDVAHVIKVVCGWQCLKTAQRRSRHFYKRCIGQLIQVDSIEGARNIIRHMFIVALNETEGCASHIETPCEQSKAFLKEIIGREEENDDLIVENVEDDLDFEQVESNSFTSWGKLIEQEARSEIVQGDRDNCQYLPALVPKVLHILKTIPLWSHLMCKQFPQSGKTGSSAAVESNFCDLKNRVFAKEALPIRLQHFVSKHIESLEGTMKIAAGQDVRSTTVLGQQKEEECSLTDPSSFGTVGIDGRNLKFSNDALCEGPESLTLLKELPVDKKDASDDLKEFVEEENWGGLMVQKKRKRKSYLEKNSEWLNIDLTQKVAVVPIGILRNANSMALKPVKLQKKNIVLTNTCAFDSIIQIWCTSYCDSTKLKNSIDAKENNELNGLVKQVIKCIGPKAYRLRCLILSGIFREAEIMPNKIVHINTQTTVEGIIRKLCSAGCLNYSYIETIRCTKCSHIRMIPISIISVNLDSVSFPQLQDQLNNYFAGRDRNNICVKKECGGATTSRIEYNKEYILIEVVSLNDGNMIQAIPQMHLNEVSEAINIDGLKYDLGGLIAYSGPQEVVKPSIIGHFKAYCLRINQKWEVYDDLLDHKEDCTGREKVYPHCIVYRI